MTRFTCPNRFAFRFLCWFLAGLMFVTPSLPVMAQGADATPVAENPKQPVLNDKTLLADPATASAVQPHDFTYLLPQACVVVAARPRQLFASPAVAMMPLEVLQAASLQETGVDVLEMETLLFSVEPFMGGPPNYALHTTFANVVEGKLNPKLTAHTQPGQLDGRQYFQSQHLQLPSIYLVDGKTLIATPEMSLQKLIMAETDPSTSATAKRLQTAQGDDLYVAINIEMLRPLINQLLMQAPIPPELLAFTPAPDLVKVVELRVNLSGAGPNELVIEANNAADAEKLVAMLQQVMERWRNLALAESAKLKQSEDPVEQALGRYQERIMNQMAGAFLPTQEDARLIVYRLAPSESGQNPMMTTAVVGVLVALLLPAVQASREAARRSQTMNHLKMLLLALLNYQDMNGKFPPSASFDSEGRPMLSWRVHILPFLEHGELYKQFHLDEPWDSEHNRKLIPLMPSFYLDPASKHTQQEGLSNYLGVKGEGMIFDDSKQDITFKDIIDGTSNTIVLLQVNDEQAAIWTKPQDWEFNAQSPLLGLAPNVRPAVFLAGFTDGHVAAISQTVDAGVFKAMLTRAGEEIVDDNLH